ncbi:hypothetical protein [Pyrococcus kukulkanii]|uniref:hypothetical protein n=1 Tax=Pyrococcus kukulkanii TaxID=1609559 RepID=UPI003561C36A
MESTARLITRLVELTRKGYIEDYEREEVSKILRELKAGGFTSEEIVFLINGKFSASWVRSLTAGTRRESEKHKKAALRLLVGFLTISEKVGGIRSVAQLLQLLSRHKISATNIISLLKEIEASEVSISDLVELVRLANSLGGLDDLKGLMEIMAGMGEDNVNLSDLFLLLRVAREYSIEEVTNLVGTRREIEEELERLLSEVKKLKRTRDALKEEVKKLREERDRLAKEYSDLAEKCRELSDVVSIVKELMLEKKIPKQTLYYVAEALENAGPAEVADIALDVEKREVLRREVKELEERRKRLEEQVKKLEAAREKAQDDLVKMARELAKRAMEAGEAYGKMMDDVLKKAKEYSFVVGLLEDLYTLLYSQDEEALRSVPIYLDVVLLEAIERHAKVLGVGEIKLATTLGFLKKELISLPEHLQGRGSPITRKDRRGTS